MHLFSRDQLQQRLNDAFADPARLRSLAASAEAHLRTAGADASKTENDGPTDPSLPPSAVDWLARLTLLQGVPFPYLVPDEAMLPRESIRFFYLNMNWIDALIDGALSLGRNLTTANASATANGFAKAFHPAVHNMARARAGTVRHKALGVKAQIGTANLQVVTGFLLRSTVVEGYPGIGVNAYPQGGTPNDPAIKLLPILRLEQLGPGSGVLFCLVAGDAVQVDVHEPPEGLHYGIDTYNDAGGVISATKSIHPYTRSGSKITIPKGPPVALPGFASCFRPNSPRVMMMQSVAGLIQSATSNPVDSAVMGFEMTEGVGQVSFLKRNS